MEKKLHRDVNRKMIAGVCAGLAEYFGMDISVVRIIFGLTLVLHGCGVGIYILLWIVLPAKNYIFADPNVDYKVPPSPFGNMGNAGDPFMGKGPVTRSNATVIGGTILILLGSFFLLDQLDFIPDLDLERLWPVILIIIGAVFIVAQGKKQPWEHDNWHHTTTTEEKTEETKGDNNTTL